MIRATICVGGTPSQRARYSESNRFGGRSLYFLPKLDLREKQALEDKLQGAEIKYKYFHGEEETKRYILVSIDDSAGVFLTALTNLGINLVDAFVSSSTKQSSKVARNHSSWYNDFTPSEEAYLSIKQIAEAQEADIILLSSPNLGAYSKIGEVKTSSVVIRSLTQYLSLKEKGREFKGNSHQVWEYAYARSILEPKYHMFEGKRVAVSLATEVNQILRCRPKELNSSGFTAQNRERFFWTNFSIKQVQPSPLVILDILETMDFEADTPSWIDKSWGTNTTTTRRNLIKRPHSKASALTPAMIRGQTTIFCKNKEGGLHRYSITELETIQGLPKGYTAGVSLTQRTVLLGTVSTLPVIEHIFKELPCHAKLEL